MKIKQVVAVVMAVFWGHVASAGVTSKVLQESVELIATKFGKEVAEEGIDRLSKRMSQLAIHHGDEVVSAAFRKVGPVAGRVAQEAAENSGVALRLLGKYGDDAVELAVKPRSLKLIAQYGDDAAESLVRHGTVGEGLVETFAESGAKALAKVTPQNGRRIAMLASDKTLQKPVMDVIAKYGDPACEFLWRNKFALATGAAMATFLADPEPFLNGTIQLSEIVADTAIRPLAEEAGRHYGGTFLLLGGMLTAVVFVYFWFFDRSGSRAGLVVAQLQQELQKRFFDSTPKP